MVRTARWKYIHWQGLPGQLFDLQEDPDELQDLGGRHPTVEREMRDRLLDWSLARKTRTTLTDPEVERATDGARRHGILIGVW